MMGYKKFDDTVIDYIRSLRRTYRIVLLSNSEGKYLRDVLSDKNIETLFDEIFISGELGVAKPDKEMFDLVLQKLQLNIDEVVFVDDQQKNIVAAESIGIKGLLFKSVYQLKHEIGRISG
jgi:putative hydrolase of the HAD superfamily